MPENNRYFRALFFYFFLTISSVTIRIATAINAIATGIIIFFKEEILLPGAFPDVDSTVWTEEPSFDVVSVSEIAAGVVSVTSGKPTVVS